MVGKIVLVKVYFTDLSEYKIRPVYIFKKYDNEDFMFLPLSTNLNRKGVIIDNDSFESGNINKKSIIIIPKIGIIHKSLILEEIGKLKLEHITEIAKNICESLLCDKLP